MTAKSPGSARAAPVWGHLSVPAGAGVAMATATLFLGDAETAYLATLATIVLTPIALLALRGALVSSLAAFAATVILWAGPPGGARGAVVIALLVAALALELAKRLAASRSQELPVFAGVAAAMALQAVVRSQDLLDPAFELTTLVRLVALPLAAGWAVSRLVTSWGRAPALVAAGTVAALAPGFRVGATLALVGLATASWAREPAAGPRWARIGGRAAILAPAFLWRPAFGAVLAVGMFLVETPPSRRRDLLLAGASAGVLVALLSNTQGSAQSLLGTLVWVPVLLPALAWALWTRRDSSARVALVLVMAATASSFMPREEALPVPLVLLALGLARDPALRLQATWTTALLAATSLLAAYPWIRRFPVDDALAVLGLAPTWTTALAVLTVFTALTAVTLFLERTATPVAVAPRLGLLALAIAAGLALAPSHGSLVPDVITLDRDKPRWDRRFETPVAVGQLVLDSYLSSGFELSGGSVAATLIVETADGARVSWPLVVGVDTGEWAARRADVHATAPATPLPWVSWPHPDRTFFGQRYRARKMLDRRLEASSLWLELDSSLAEDTSLAVFHLELRP